MQLQCLHGQTSGTADTEEPGQADWICPRVLGGQVFGKYNMSGHNMGGQVFGKCYMGGQKWVDRYSTGKCDMGDCWISVFVMKTRLKCGILFLQLNHYSII